jgi:carboxymethylenebutenolidase
VIEFKVEDSMGKAYVAVPDSGKGPGVLVLHAWWGLDDFFKSFCDRLAGAGFVALAPDVYGGKIASTVEEADDLVSNLDRRSANATLLAALDALKAHPAVTGEGLGAVGFSLGALFALQVADQRPADIVGVVLFYGGEGPVASPLSVLGHFAEHDGWGADPPEVQELKKMLLDAGGEALFYTYPGTQHWFFESDVTAAYREEAAALAWARTVEFLRSRLEQPG